ncbi:MAG TPA: hypothetical protein PKV72_04670, partial [Candidatus Peribacteria bacterium]|nr:hypothetical protein [Candidatus Peribacteria bacterium]
MQNIPGFGGPQPEVKSKVEAAAKSAGETPAKTAHAGIRQALTEAFGRPVADTDLSVNQTRGKFRVTVSPSVVPPKQNLTVFGLRLPFQRRQPAAAIDAALANVNVGAKRRIFHRLFPERNGTFHASHTFNNEEALARFTLDCRQRLGNPPAEAEAKNKSDADAKTKREAEVKTAAPAPQPPRPPVSAPGGLPGGLPGMPGG